jgi:thiamine pyrophosphate-dependent acetolactate synthase large subunit-like protein
MKRAQPDAVRARSRPTGRPTHRPSLRELERPLKSPAQNVTYGSDVVADTLRALDVRYIALVPGASFRGLHDSLVNHLGNERPQILLCINEAHAVAIAHGYAKVTGRAMAVALHSNVGLFEGTMAIFNAWCDRMPVIVIGATGPVDADKRRPWIDWIHTARDQGAIVRGYVKWDDQPATAVAARESILRAAWLAQTAPMAPVYVNLDAGMQEDRLESAPPPIDVRRYVPATPSAAPADLVARAAELLRSAKRPLILAGRVSRSLQSWDERVELAERLHARVATDLKTGAAFPTDHPLHVGTPSMFPGAETLEAIRAADAILSLDWVDLAGTLKSACGAEAPSAKIIQVSLDHLIHNGWSMDHQALPPVDLMLAAVPDMVVPALLAALGPGKPSKIVTARPNPAAPQPTDGPLTADRLARALRQAIGKRDPSLLHTTISWSAPAWPFSHPLDWIGSDGGGGVGGGPGIAVGAALALKDSGRLPVAVCGDGNYLMGVTALWTATHYRIPLLLVVANNRSFYNDEVHQERVARARGRPVENKWIGQRISDPDVDLAAMARAQGAVGLGPVTQASELEAAFGEAIAEVEAGQAAVVDVRVEPGYAPAIAAATRGD